MGRECSTNWGQEDCLYDLSGKSRRKERPLGRLRRRRLDNIKTDLRAVGFGGMDWIDLAQDMGQ
jgi:hypothetical protein